MIIGTINGDEQVLIRLKSIPTSLHQKLVDVVKRLSIGLQGHVVQKKLSGQVLKRKTGTLARSIKWQVKDSASGVVGIVGSRINESKPLKYAAPHEYGFSGVVTVREHLRMQTMAWGKSIAPRQVTVKEHQMHMNVPERSFLRSSLADNAEQIRTAIDKAVASGVKNGA